MKHKSKKAKTPAREVSEHLGLTPKAIALISAIESGLVRKITVNGIEGYDTTFFDYFFHRFGRDLAKEYGFVSADDLWQKVAEHRRKKRQGDLE